VELPYGGVVRVGSIADFFFSSNYRNLSLDNGTMMFSAPKDKEGVTIRSGNVISTTIGGSLQLSNVNGQVKVITLDGMVFSTLASSPGNKSRTRPVKW
jgi:ferric-dicitrate binding protein FerR (iron transport regulator)